ncbi:hypothetical protein CHS0354_029310, partial [Potamilus streckersoni]
VLCNPDAAIDGDLWSRDGFGFLEFNVCKFLDSGFTGQSMLTSSISQQDEVTCECEKNYFAPHKACQAICRTNSLLLNDDKEACEVRGLKQVVKESGAEQYWLWK